MYNLRIFNPALLASILFVIVFIATSLPPQLGVYAGGQQIPLTRQIVKWIFKRVHSITSQADSIAKKAAENIGNFNAIHFLKFMNLVDKLSLFEKAKELDIADFDWLRRKIRTYKPVREQLSKIFSVWIEGKVGDLVTQENHDIEANTKMKNLPPSKEWKQIFNELNYFMKNVSIVLFCANNIL